MFFVIFYYDKSAAIHILCKFFVNMDHDSCVHMWLEVEERQRERDRAGKGTVSEDKDSWSEITEK